MATSLGNEPRRSASIDGVPQEERLGDLSQFYRTFFPPLVRRAVRKHGLSFEDAGDVVQDAFVLAVTKLDPSKNPKAWLYQVVDHLSVNHTRKRLRRAHLIEKWAPGERGLPRRVSVDD
jgi:DNA-directed RNA polymerase specialized sigma24 family protein